MIICMFGKRRVYLDHASATLIDPRVARAVFRALLEFQGNPSAPHEEGRNARAAIEMSRTAIARSLSVKAEELMFTSGGTEANNLAIRGLIEGLRVRGASYREIHIVTTAIEHSSILKTVAALEREGVSVSYAMPDSDGIVRAESVRKLVRPETALISMAHVNSEIGTIQPIGEVSQLVRDSGIESTLSRFAPEATFPVIHADAAQSPLYLDAGAHVLGSQLVSYDAQKIAGPKGVGVLYRNFSVPMAPLYGGGTQERSLRPGTENVPAIFGAGIAFQLAKEGREPRMARVSQLRDYLIDLVKEKIPDARLTGSPKERIANNAHFVIPGVSGDYLAVLMDKEGVAVSPRSSCIGSDEMRSHVVSAVVGEESAKSTIRFSLGEGTGRRDCTRAVDALYKVIPLARRIK